MGTVAKKVEPTIALITFGVFMAEAVIHYNLGVQSQSEFSRCN